MSPPQSWTERRGAAALTGLRDRGSWPTTATTHTPRGSAKPCARWLTGTGAAGAPRRTRRPTVCTIRPITWLAFTTGSTAASTARSRETSRWSTSRTGCRRGCTMPMAHHLTQTAADCRHTSRNWICAAACSPEASCMKTPPVEPPVSPSAAWFRKPRATWLPCKRQSRR